MGAMTLRSVFGAHRGPRGDFLEPDEAEKRIFASRGGWAASRQDESSVSFRPALLSVEHLLLVAFYQNPGDATMAASPGLGTITHLTPHEARYRRLAWGK
jgi:hypothetical protein